MAKQQPSRRAKNEDPAPLAARRAGRSVADEARTPAPWLVLGLLIEQPSHGYELCQRYRSRFGALLPMSVPRVYGALDKLRDERMIEQVSLKSAQSAPRQHMMRRTYRATRAGVKAYHSWVAERMSDDFQRPQLLGLIASAGVLDVDAVLEVIDRYDRECMEELRTLGTGSERVEGGSSSLEELTDELVRDQRRRELAARHDWAVHARRTLEAHKRRAPEVDER